MKRFRVLMMLASLLAVVGAANGQSLTIATIQAIEASDLTSANFGRNASATVAAAAQVQRCEGPESCGGWHMQALEQAGTAWQRLRAMYAANKGTTPCDNSRYTGTGYPKQAFCAPETTNSGTARVVFGAQSCPALLLDVLLKLQRGGNATATVDCLKIATGNCPAPADCLKIATGNCPAPVACPLGFVGGKPAAPCCCAKACACCESCKVKATNTAQAGRGQASPRIQQILPSPNAPVHGTYTPAAPVQTWTIPLPAVASAPVWATPVSPPPGARMVIGMPVAGHSAKPAHLVTPDFEAHCQRIVHRGGLIILEGDVMLLCRKHAQPIRIEAQRVTLNIHDGTFHVDSTGGMSAPTAIGVLRTSATMTPHGDVAYPPAHREIIQIVPVR